MVRRGGVGSLLKHLTKQWLEQLFKSLLSFMKVTKPLTSREHIEYSFGRKNWDVDEQYEQI